MAGQDDDRDRRTERPAGAGAAWARELLDLLRPTGSDVRRIADWLAATLDATVALLDADGTPLAGTPVDLDERLAADLAAGRISSAAWEGEGRFLRVIRVELPGPGKPSGTAPGKAPGTDPGTAGLLAVARTTPFDRRAAEIVARTATVLDLLGRAERTAATGDRLARATSDLRLAILQLLMVEDTVAARRVAAGLWPGLLDTDTACVHVLESAPEDRDRLAEDCVAATHDEALVVRCPAVDGHVIVVAPGERAATALRGVCAGHPGAFLGGSTRQSLARTAAAYGQAVSALAVARFRPDRTAVYAQRTHPESLMDPETLRTWTARLLRPLDTLPHHTRAELLATTRLGLEFTAVKAAKVLGVSRNTVRARMERVEHLLGADFTDLTVRATVHLALNTQAGEAGTHTARPPAAGRLDDLLTGAALLTWARDLLGRLDTDARDLRRTLRTWIAAGGNAERAAHQLGVHAQTVREHVRGAEPALERQLLAAGRDLYEVVLAHLATGELGPPDLREPPTAPPETGDRDATMHT